MRKLLYVSFAVFALFAFACKKEAPAVEAPVAVQEEEAVATEESAEATDEEAVVEEATDEATTDTE